MVRSLTDGMLVNRAGRGDAIAFSQLVERHYQRAVGVAAALLPDVGAAHDVSQGAFARVCRTMPAYATAWEFYVGLYRQVLLSSFALDVKGATAQEHDGDSMAERLAVLPRMHRAALALRECAGFTYHQIAHILQCRVATVQHSLAGARTTLATSMVYRTGTDLCGRGGGG